MLTCWTVKSTIPVKISYLNGKYLSLCFVQFVFHFRLLIIYFAIHTLMCFDDFYDPSIGNKKCRLKCLPADEDLRKYYKEY